MLKSKLKIRRRSRNRRKRRIGSSSSSDHYHYQVIFVTTVGKTAAAQEEKIVHFIIRCYPLKTLHQHHQIIKI